MNIKAAILGATLAQVPVGASAESYGKYEVPPYVVEARFSQIELRAYAPHIQAEVTVRGAERAALNQGFRVLAGYIFGGNTSQAGIDMTAPVGQTGEDGLWTVTFTMPREWTLETLPVPDNEAIRLREVAAHKEVVHTFSGRATVETIAAAEQILREEAQKQGLETIGALRTYYYDDPMTLPWKRRNEVALMVAR